MNNEIITEGQLIINEYFANGFNGTQAVKTVKPDLNLHQCSVKWQQVKTAQKHQEYIRQQQEGIKARAQISNDMLTGEYLTWLYSDITDYIGLQPHEIKELPPVLKRCIQSIKTREHYNKSGDLVGISTEIKLIDKAKAAEMVNKHLGYYSEDNLQKGVNINVLNVLQKQAPTALNSLLKAMQEADEAEK